ncbi:MAG: SGNH/GDSL hydrolase family protein [Rhodospirillales bacterium]|nr:SGNH/GDSL hydrolase family protein [Rhodospirillales bacterium]
MAVTVVGCLVALALLFPRELEIDQRADHEQGFAWTVSLPLHYLLSDGMLQSEFSPLRVYEDDRLLGPAHCLHDTIRRQGGGCFSHWKSTLYFSTSDNSNPNTNGRTYRLAIPVENIWLALAVWVFIGGLVMVLSGFVLAPVIVARLTGKGAGLVIALCSAALLVMLRADVIDVRSLSGRGLYGLVLFIPLILVVLTAFLAFHKRPAGTGERMLVTWQGVAAALLAVEIIARIVPVYDSLADNPGIEHFWPDWSYFPYNEFGHRDRDYSADKSIDTFRILMLGDSFTEGAGLSREQTFSHQLEQILSAVLKTDGLTVEVYNTGHSGWNTLQQANLLDAQGPTLKPDMVIVNYVANDPEIPAARPRQENALSLLTPVHETLISGFGSYAYYRLYISAIQQHESMTPYINRIYDPQGEGWKSVQSATEDIGRYLASHKISGFVAHWPIFMDGSYAFQSMHDQVRVQVEGAGLPYWDLRDVLSPHQEDMSRWRLSPYDGHPNAAANALVARAYADRILESPEFKAWKIRR